MSDEVAKSLGATCPKGGSFYVCHDKPTQFVGCCSVDPCKTATGVCPDDNLKYTSFDKYSFNSLKPQLCVSDAPEVQWWTCAEAKPNPFMGCCSVNPCETGSGCPDGKIFAAKLNDKRDQAEPFLTAEQRSAGGGLATGAKVGIAVGAVLGFLLIAGLAFFFWRRRRQQNASAAGSYEQYGGNYPESKTGGSHMSSYTAASTPSVATQMPYDPYAQQQNGQLYPQYNQSIHAQRGFPPSSVYIPNQPTPPPMSSHPAPHAQGQVFAAELHSESASDVYEGAKKPTPTELP
ncbi:unnamed protein product [Clonostachys rosea]|uniref:Uncharacterized protein n=1 Tax=Bionectria ochroleuca TaxID=29856 RepID=A0ABY6TSV6_BIOOC|nr:unnamed protein product [Clonostachys rosea]